VFVSGTPTPQVAIPARPAPLNTSLPGVDAVLYDQSELVTHTGTGVGGADESWLQTNLGMTIFGYGHAVSANISVADDFPVTGGNWNVNGFELYAYQSFSGNTSTITGTFIQIWDGVPGAGGNIIAGDLTTNRLMSSTWSNMYRLTNTAAGTNVDRPVMRVQASFPTTNLTSGNTYWVEWRMSGSLASGPWSPPRTILGSNTTGNGRQSISGAWANLGDAGGLGQGLAFKVLGDSGTATTPFCTAKAGLVCGTPAISASGVSSVMASSGFVIKAGPARDNRSGILLYNNAGLTAPGLPFEGGTLCVNAMGLRRAGSTNSGGSCPPNPIGCNGTFAIDMNTFAKGLWVVPDCAGAPTALPPNNPAGFLQTMGITIDVQFWGRDSVATGSFLSDGLSYVQGP
jgi:hypothetical protein